MLDKYFLLRFASSLEQKAMPENTVTKTVEGLKVETDFHDLMVRVYRAGDVIRQFDCSKMSLAEYDLAIAKLIAEVNGQRSHNEN